MQLTPKKVTLPMAAESVVSEDDAAPLETSSVYLPAGQRVAPGGPSAASSATKDDDLDEESEGGLAVTKTVSARSRSGVVLELPPGLAVGEDMPSNGSVLHASGNCQPCAWFWRPGSCHNGRECGHCHLCPEGEIKARKRRKTALLRGGAAAAATPKTAVSAAPKVAAAAAPKVAASAAPKVPEATADAAYEPRKVPIPEAIVTPGATNRPTTGASTAQPRKVALPADAFAPRRAFGDVLAKGDPDVSEPGQSARHMRLADLLKEQAGLDNEREADVAPEGMGEKFAAPEQPEKIAIVLGPDELPTCPSHSLGADLHGSGQCRPCAWYWRPGSCQNGENCGHCHMCDKGELKSRKKQKQAMFRLGLATPKPNTAHPVSEDAFGIGVASRGETKCSSRSPDNGNDASEQGSTTASNSEHEHEEDSGAAGAGSADLAAVGGSSGKARTRTGTFIALPPGLRAPPGTPSHGSALHKVGNCWPCAYFWTQGGCPLGEDCGYCHYCRDGEMRSRKHSKIAMMRLGLATPKAELGAKSFGLK